MSIEEKDAIREVLAEYCFALDNFRFTDMAALFTADGTWETAFGKATGHAAIAALGASFIKDIPAPPRRIHFVTNIVIRLDDDSAQVVSNWTQIQNGPQGPMINSAGGYEDRMVKQAARWMFQHRKIDRFIK